jgi:proline iminopeptidase
LIWKKKYDLHKSLKTFYKPVLLLCGRQDPIGESTAHQIRETLTQADLTFIEECGHYPWIEQPEKFYEIIIGFIENIR